MGEVRNIPELFGSYVFNDAAMRDHLPKGVYKKLRETIDAGKELDPKIADCVAHGMKEWALEHGATHFTHWFQPMTGVTAEKHDAFISAPGAKGQVIMEFSGKELVKGEPDASSFPSGGLRATFEARGYTTWDCTSPAFIRETGVGTCLYIPTAFCSYTGEALDKKTPLLRSMEALDKQALRVLKLFGNTTSRRIVPSVGIEQEYFIISQDDYTKRKDLIFTGRTLFGAPASKGQELDDHYFGSIREKVGEFMYDIDEELWKLGVPAKTEHNEVAPGQHELAPIYEQVNVAVDHNQLMMEVMKRTAEKHNLHCLLSEKPFEGVNGSGKHNNWSLTTDDGINMLNPGDTPHENIQFLLVLGCIMKAVNRHADLLRVSAANVGNEHRLGANEAPPAIISMFVGAQLEDVIDQLIDTGKATRSIHGAKLETGVATLPDFEKDATDRNRTSPFAFTGNKFEFRMLGSSDSCAGPNVVLNLITAEAFKEAADALEGAADFSTAVHDMIKKLFTENRRIVFNGNGYTDAWVEEAERRGLPNIRSMVDAIPALGTEKAVKLYTEFGVLSETELKSRIEINYEAYVKAINIEARTMIHMASKDYIPSVMSFVTSVADSMGSVMAVCEEADVSAQKDVLMECSALLAESKKALKNLIAADNNAAAISGMAEKAKFFHDTVVPAMEALRAPIDKLELLVDKEYWPVPSYADMLYAF